MHSLTNALFAQWSHKAFVVKGAFEQGTIRREEGATGSMEVIEKRRKDRRDFFFSFWFLQRGEN